MNNINEQFLDIHGHSCQKEKKKRIMETNNQIIVYDDFAGMPLQVTFLGNQWWVTSPDEILQPLKKYFDGDDKVAFCYLCNAGGKVDALGLAAVLGKALENPFDTIDVEILQRVRQLKRLGVTECWAGEKLTFEWNVFSNEKFPRRKGKYSLLCEEISHHLTMFNMDSFDDEAEAEEWAKTYFDFLRTQKIKVNEIKKPRF